MSEKKCVYTARPIYYKPRLSSDATDMIAVLLTCNNTHTVYKCQGDTTPVIDLVLKDLSHCRDPDNWASPVAGAYKGKQFTIDAEDEKSAINKALAILTRI